MVELLSLVKFQLLSFRCVTTVVPVVGGVCSVVVISVTVDLVVLTDIVVGPWVDIHS